MAFTLSLSESPDKLAELRTETLMRLRAPNSLFLKHGFEENDANMLTVKDLLSE